MAIGSNSKLQNRFRGRLETEAIHAVPNRCHRCSGLLGEGMLRTSGIGMGRNGIAEPLAGHR